MADSRWHWLGVHLALVGACASTAPLDQHLLQEILDQQDRRDASDPGLRLHLGHPNPTVRAWAARALGAMGADDAAPTLAHALGSDPDADVRRQAALALGLLRAGQPDLRDALRRDADPATRAISAWAIGREGSATAGLAAGLDDNVADVRSACATALALGKTADAEALVLLACWRERDPTARAAMLAAIGIAPTPLAAPLLLAAALQPLTAATRAQVLAGLRGLTTLAQRHRDGFWVSPRERARLRTYLWLEDAPVSAASAELAVALSAHDARQQLADEQAFLDAWTQASAPGSDAILARAWADFPWSPNQLRTVVATLERAAVGPDASVRAAALYAYAAVAPESAMRMVRQSLGARDARQRAVAVRALAALPLDDAVAALWMRAGADRAPIVRAALATATLRARGRGSNAALTRLELHAPAVAETLAMRVPDEAAALDVERLTRGLATVDADDTIFRVALVRAIALLAEGDSSNAADLQLLRADADPAVRRTVQELAGERPEAWPDARTFQLGIDLPWSTYAKPPRIRFTTTAGPFEIELDAAAAPIHVQRLIDRVRNGQSGSSVRRHGPSMVVFGNPSQLQSRPDELLRCELSPARLSHSGIVGFAPAVVPDCDGPDLFVTLAPRPDLQGSVTVVGRVCDGMEIVEQLRVDDRFLDIALVPGPD